MRQLQLAHASRQPHTPVLETRCNGPGEIKQRRRGVTQRGNRLQPRTPAGQHERGAQSCEPSSRAQLMLGFEGRWGSQLRTLAVGHGGPAGLLQTPTYSCTSLAASTILRVQITRARSSATASCCQLISHRICGMTSLNSTCLATATNQDGQQACGSEAHETHLGLK